MTGESIKDICDISYIFVWSPFSRSKRNPLGHRTATKKTGPFPSDESRSDEKHRKVVGFVVCILFFLSKFMRLELNPKFKKL